jgi:hypothetical protein
MTELVNAFTLKSDGLFIIFIWESDGTTFLWLVLEGHVRKILYLKKRDNGYESFTSKEQNLLI